MDRYAVNISASSVRFCLCLFPLREKVTFSSNLQAPKRVSGEPSRSQKWLQWKILIKCTLTDPWHRIIKAPALWSCCQRSPTVNALSTPIFLFFIIILLYFIFRRASAPALLQVTLVGAAICNFEGSHPWVGQREIIFEEFALLYI